MPYRLATPQYNTDFIHPTHKVQVSVMRIMKKAGIQALAERVGFEPTEELPSLVFKTSSISRSDISPYKSTSPYVRSISSMAENFVGDSGPLHSRCECLDALPKRRRLVFQPSHRLCCMLDYFEKIIAPLNLMPYRLNYTTV